MSILKKIEELNSIAEKHEAIVITNSDASAEVAAAGNVNLAGSAIPLLQLCDYWSILRTVLNIVKIVTNAKADAKIDEIISWGDTICGSSRGH